MKTLHGKLFLVVAILVAALGGLALLLQALTFRNGELAMAQGLNEALAERLVGQYFATSASEAGARAEFHRLMTVNPSIELYLVAGDGRLKAFSAPAGEVRRTRIDVGPLKMFIAGRLRFPAFADDPKNPGGRALFSAALLDPAEPDAGFLYVVLRGSEYRAAAGRMEGASLLRGVLIALGLGIVAALAAAFFVLATLTGRLRRLAGVMDAFRAGRFREPVPIVLGPGGSGDEIDRVARAYNGMIALIRTQMAEIATTNAARRELIAGVSHDLRTPLASLRGYLETLLVKENLPDRDRRAYLEIAFRQSDTLHRLIEELFELAKLEGIDSGIASEPFQISELVQDVLQKFRLAAEKQNITLTGSLAPAAPLLHGDVALLERMLDNLLENAIRHTAAGGQVGVNVTVEPSLVRLEVADSGSGIPEADVPRVFERFYRVDQARGEGWSGAGLGLSIANRIVELHGGSITVASRVGVGTIFTIDLPRAVGAASLHCDASRAPAATGRDGQEGAGYP